MLHKTEFKDVSSQSLKNASASKIMVHLTLISLLCITLEIIVLTAVSNSVHTIAKFVIFGCLVMKNLIIVLTAAFVV